ncbi:Uncharacterised protein [Nocardia otitidiscaviarum]|uniref:Potassium/proton antiporter subunit KhtT-like N-terminal domain-containing protein n=1 Tax=Nocardia otitidiscaviarum TaxID=1823 RepID=A0A378Y6K2_9NOCA|nr:hypothetical protein [Nocardia otitidiscaviarum]MBF6241528.1 hypothetical protein [Nocardia otitidiscaviarum]SUA72845.1 Uncharacterised protein [Nocardia otitidiscaviarum]
MQVDRSTVPGRAVLYHCRPRDGSRFGIVGDRDGIQQLVIYDPADGDTPLQTITLEPDEADQLAQLLHSAPIRDRLAELERRVNQLGDGRRIV